MKTVSQIALRRFRTIALSLAGFTAAVALSTAAVAHQVDSEPMWCDPSNTGTDDVPEIGKFPGPRNHHKMNRVNLAEFDLGKEIPDLLGRNVRVRFWLMEPGGMIAEHCHSDRPAYVYLLQGQVIETKEVDGKPVRKVINAGDAALEGNGTRHWWINKSEENVLMVAVDLPNTNQPHPERHPDPARTAGAVIKKLGTMKLSEEYPHIPGVAGYGMRGRLITLDPGGSIGLTYHAGRPGIAYVIEGILLEHRADSEVPVVRRKDAVSTASNGIWTYWQNKSPSPAKLFVFDVLDCGACTDE